MRREEDGGLRVLRGRPLREKCLPDLRRLVRVIAGQHHQLEPNLIGLPFVVAREGKDARQSRELDEWSDEPDASGSSENVEEQRGV